MFVYVLNQKGKPLMPCKPAIARLLLKQGKAKVKSRVPFVIKMLKDTTEFIQPIVGGMDTGSVFIGAAATANGKVLYQSEVKLRNDISKKMQQRAMYRRTRRGRKCRYRQARWANRASMRKTGRLAPSVRSKVDSHLREKKYIESIMPITYWKVETASFDIHKITNPDVVGSGYQEGEQKDFYNVKAFVLHRDNYQCQSGRKVKHSKKLHVHHVIFRTNGGSDMPGNLKVLCETCHDDLHKGKFELIAKKSKTKQATEIGIVKAQLKKQWDFEETYGYETKFKREQVLQLPKTHYNDAVAICCEDGELVQSAAYVYHKRHVASGDYQQTKGSRSEKRIPTGKLFGLKKHDFIRTPQGSGFVKGKRSTGYFALENIFGDKVHASANIKKNTVRLTARTTTLTQIMESASDSSRS
jgi:5-methylcytosine-specific restriction endonuclease McrA